MAVIVGHAAGVIADRAAALEREHGVRLELIHNDRAQDWNNAYSLWLAREYLGGGALLCNGDTVHPVSVEKTLLKAREQRPAADLILAVDAVKPLADEEMKVTLDERGLLRRITKQLDPAQAHGEYIGVTLIQAAGARPWPRRWRRPGAGTPASTTRTATRSWSDRDGEVAVAPIGEIAWVEVDNHDDLRRARLIAPGYQLPGQRPEPMVAESNHVNTKMH